jgi:hypothetical protein
MVGEYFGAPAHLKTESAQDAWDQERIDAIQEEFRARKKRPSIRRDPPPLPPALVPTDDELKLRLAQELEYARRMLDAMGNALSCDMSLLARHGVPLQTVDICGQILGHIADVIRSSDPKGAVERIGMGDLRSRLQRQRIG